MSTIKVDAITTRSGSGEISLGTTGSQTINRTGNGDLIAFQKGGVDSGSISIETNGTAFDGEASHAGLKMFATQIAPRQNGADIDNTIDLGSATVRFKDIFISGGLKVGGTGAANTLDDYEEGTFTPTSVSNLDAISNVSGHYVKIGTFVKVLLYVTIDPTNSAAVEMGGLPFAVANKLPLSSIEGAGIAWSDDRMYVISCHMVNMNRDTGH